jgi:ArsR family transcriptional regulator
VVRLASALRHVAEQNLAEVERIVSGYFRDRDRLEPVTGDELVKRMKEGMVTVLDVRPAVEFAHGHLPGAVNVPLAELERRLGEIPRNREIVAYCRGPYCVLSYEAVAALRKRGYRVRRLAEGFPEWKAAGLPIQTSPV